MNVDVKRHKTSDASRARILKIAEEMFIESGFEGTSMRDLTKRAEVNLSAVNYYFGSKQELFRYILRDRLNWLTEERLRRLDELEALAKGQPLKPSKIVEAFFGAFNDLMSRDPASGKIFMRLLGRVINDPSEFTRSFVAKEYSTVIQRYKDALVKATPGVPQIEVLWRFHFMLGAVSNAISGIGLLSSVWNEEDVSLTHWSEEIYPRFMSFILGGLRAPLPEGITQSKTK